MTEIDAKDVAIVRAIDAKHLNALEFAAVQHLAVNGRERLSVKDRLLVQELADRVKRTGSRGPWSDAIRRGDAATAAES